MIDENSTKEEVLDAVKTNGCALKYASEGLKNNPSVAFEAMKNDLFAGRYIGKELVDGIISVLEHWSCGMPIVWEDALRENGWMRGCENDK